MMKKINSLSEKRLIVECNVNGKTAAFLIDTGASIGLIDKNQTKKYNLLSSRKYTGTIVGAGGEIENPYICDNIINIEDKIMNQFLLVDLSNIVDSIKRETGITILGIVSLPQMKFIGMNIDTNDNLLILE
jgi:predicted aspartyl protease